MATDPSLSVFYECHPNNLQNRYRKYPGWVRKILIRRVTDIAAIGINEKNEPIRFEKAFQGIPKDVWKVFEEPEECYDFLGATEDLGGA